MQSFMLSSLESDWTYSTNNTKYSKTSLVQSPLTTLSQETRLAYTTTLLSPHEVISSPGSSAGYWYPFHVHILPLCILHRKWRDWLQL